MSPVQELVLMLQQAAILVNQLMASVAPAVAGAGMQLWQGLALIVVVWTGAQMALSGGGVNMAAVVRMVIGLSIPLGMLQFYTAPLPGAGRSVPDLLRRLLSLDYVLDHRTEPWLATETEKVAALTAAGAPEDVLPHRVYQGRRDARRRYFAHKLPLALDADRATFVFVQAEDATVGAVRAWGETHAGLWAALRAAGRAVEVVVVGRDPVRLAAAEPVLDAWTRAPAASQPRLDETGRGARAELAAIRTALAAGDLPALEVYGGINGALARMRHLAAGKAGTGRAKPAITSGRTWRSARVPE